MIYELRTYTTRPTMLKPQLQLLDEYGMAPIARNMGYPVVLGAQEDQNVNSYVHIYAHDSFEQRMERQAAMRADPEMQVYLAKLRGSENLVNMDCRFLIAPDFYDPAKGGKLIP